MLDQHQLATLTNLQNNVDREVNALHGPIAWGVYWADLDIRILGLGGDITAPTANAGFGLVQPPELPPKFPANSNKALVVLLNDCFDDTVAWMARPAFSPVQALANHIRLLRI